MADTYDEIKATLIRGGNALIDANAFPYAQLLDLARVAYVHEGRLTLRHSSLRTDEEQLAVIRAGRGRVRFQSLRRSLSK